MRVRALSPWILSSLAMTAGCGGSEDGHGEGGRGFTPDGDVAQLDEDQIAPPALARAPDSAPKVVFLGDSIGAGLHLPAHLAFPELLRQRLAAAGSPFELVSSCESGRTTAGGKSHT